MERPPSQMENVKPSGLKPPSRVPNMAGVSSGTGRVLLESSQSDLNVKPSISMPPPNGTLKHKIAGCAYQASHPIAAILIIDSLLSA